MDLGFTPFGCGADWARQRCNSTTLYRNAFGETDSTIFVDARDETVLPTPLEYNPAVDYAGRLTIAAIGKSSTTQSEVLFLSDSELLQNGYGLMTDDSVPRYSGNYVFAQGVAEWLLGFPEDEDIALPDDFTWISIDGHADDWSDQVARYPDDTEAVPSSSYRIEQYRMFRDDQYLYIRIDTNEPPRDVTSVNLRFDVDNDGLNDVTIEIHPDGSGERRASEVRSFSDARFAVGEILELRIPLRIIPKSAAYAQHLRSIHIGHIYAGANALYQRRFGDSTNCDHCAFRCQIGQ